jgi:uncharacterized membrane protein
MNRLAVRTLALAALTSVATIALGDTYTVDYPGAVTTDLSGINAAGVMVGTYTDNSGATHGFQLNGDGFQAINYPSAISTAAISINSRGDVAGFFLDAANQWHGFVLSNGDYFVQDYPSATTGSFTLGIGANETMVGEFKTGQSFGQLGFAWMLRDGEYVQLMPPDCNGDTPANPVQAFATSVSPRGEVVGRLIDAAGHQCAWKLDQDGTYSILQASGASLTNARGISATGEVVGVYRLGVNHGFVVSPHDFANFISIDFPGAASTRALGINSRGDIVGTYALVGPTGVGHGFLLERGDE